MSTSDDARFWDRTSRKYAQSPVADQDGYERSLDRTRAQLKPSDRVLELGCGTGSTALRLAGAVHSYLATDISSEMIAIGEEKHRADPVAGLALRTATVEDLAAETTRFDAVLAFNYLHLVHDLPATLRRIHDLLAPQGLLISKTPCLGDMNPLLRLALPVARAFGKAPHVGVFRSAQLQRLIEAAGFDIRANERHASKSSDRRPYIVARKK